MGRAEFRTQGPVAVGSILYKGMLVEFLVDASDVELIKDYSWHLASNSYIATSLVRPQDVTDLSGAGTQVPLSSPKLCEVKRREVKRREVYLHAFLLKPGPDQTVLHISKNGLDNRRQNLKLVDAAKAQAIIASQTTKKSRSAEMPALCGIKSAEIPRHIWYVQANGYHRDRFAIEFKSEGILWKSTSSKKVSLQEKLDQAKAKLQEFYSQHPHLDTSKEEEMAAALQASFDAAVAAVAAVAASSKE
jgi:hypothetical protein